MNSALNNQLSAFLFKTSIIAHRKRGAHMILLVAIQAFLLAAFLFVRNRVNSGKEDEGGGNSYRVTRPNPLHYIFHDEYKNDYWNSNNGIHPPPHLRVIVLDEVNSDESNRLKMNIVERLREARNDIVCDKKEIKTTAQLDTWILSESNDLGDGDDEHRPQNIYAAIVIKAKEGNQYDITFQFKQFYSDDWYPMEQIRFLHYHLWKSVNEAINDSNHGATRRTTTWNLSVARRSPGDIKNSVGAAIVGVGTLASFLILLTSGLFVQLCISEKEDKILMLMRLNGLTFFGYFLAQWICFMGMQLFALACALVMFYSNPFLVYSKVHLLVVPMFLLLMSQVACFSVFMSMFFKRAMVASSLTLSMMIFVPFFVTFIAYSREKSWYFSILPLFGGCVTITRIGILSGRTLIESLILKEIWTGLLAGFLWSVIFYFLCNYLYNVLEQGYSGTLRPWHYPITDFFEARKEKAFSKNVTEKISEESIALLDSDVRQMAELINNDYDQVVKSHSLVYRNIKKIYKGGKLAVEDVSIALKGNQIFGLLGPNGAGKTTLMHITAGLYDASSGTVVLEGHDSRTNRREYLSKIEFCPQHDIYWKLLTVKEHLRFFELLRGSKKSEIDDRIAQTLEAVRLTTYAGTLASKISGGERRRMSLAMALSGDSKVVLLDEPTTGLDPKVRRMVWDIISESRHGRLVILTTHSMEEAELLSETITIMAHGRLKCLGTAAHLKKKFGGQIFVNFENEPGRFQDAVQGIREACPEGTEVSVVSEGASPIHRG